MYLEQQVKIGASTRLTFGAWDPRVGVIPHHATLSIPDLGIEDSPATIRNTGEIAYPLAGRVTRGRPDGLLEAVWKLQIPVTGSQILTEDPSLKTHEIEIPFDLDLVDELEVSPKPALPTPDEIRRTTLYGIPLVDSDGHLYSDEAIQSALDVGRGWVEEICHMLIGKPDPADVTRLLPYLVSSEVNHPTRDILDEPYDLEPQVFANFGYLQLRKRPIVAMEQLSIKIGDQTVFEFPKEWLEVYGEAAQIRIVPATAAHLPTSAYGLAFPSLMSSRGLLGQRASQPLPGVIRATYRAGLTRLPDELRRAIMHKAGYDILNTISDAVIAGIASQSISLDGLSQSVQTTSSAENSTYSPNMGFLKKMLDSFVKDVAPKYAGIRMVVL